MKRNTWLAVLVTVIFTLTLAGCGGGGGGSGGTSTTGGSSPTSGGTSSPAVTYSISGSVIGDSGATVTATPSGTVTTASTSGYTYTLSNLPDGTYTLTASDGKGTVFTPSSQTVTVKGANVTYVDFAVANPPALSTSQSVIYACQDPSTSHNYICVESLSTGASTQIIDTEAAVDSSGFLTHGDMAPYFATLQGTNTVFYPLVSSAAGSATTSPLDALISTSPTKQLGVSTYMTALSAPTTQQFAVKAGSYFDTPTDTCASEFDGAFSAFRDPVDGNIVVGSTECTLSSGVQSDIFLVLADGTGNDYYERVTNTPGASEYGPVVGPETTAGVYPIYWVNGTDVVEAEINLNASGTNALVSGSETTIATGVPIVPASAPTDVFRPLSLNEAGTELAMQLVENGESHVIVRTLSGSAPDVDLGPGRNPVWSHDGTGTLLYTTGAGASRTWNSSADVVNSLPALPNAYGGPLAVILAAK